VSTSHVEVTFAKDCPWVSLQACLVGAFVAKFLLRKSTFMFIYGIFQTFHAAARKYLDREGNLNTSAKEQTLKMFGPSCQL
jgi:hypothetical protein